MAQNWHFWSIWAMEAYLVPCWWVGWWRAGCISQDTYLLYFINIVKLVQSQQMAFTQGPSLSNNPKIRFLQCLSLHVSFVFVIIFVYAFVFVFVVVPPQLDLHQQAPHRSTGQLAKPSEGLLSHFQRSCLEFDQKKTSNQLKIAWLGESPTEKYQHYFLERSNPCEARG